MRDFSCQYAFAHCNQLTAVKWEIDPSIPFEDFECHIPPCAFLDCRELQSVTVPSSVFDCYAFENCKNLSSINITGDNILALQQYALSGCEKLEKINGQLSSFVNRGAFTDCKSLKELTFANTPTIIYNDFKKGNSHIKDSYIGAFEGCTSLDRINVSCIDALLKIIYLHLNKNGEEEEYFDEHNAIFYNCDGGSIYIDGKKCDNITFEHPNTIINKGLFYNVHCKSIDLSNVSSIGSYAFAKSGLDLIHVPASVSSIMPYALSAKTVEFEVADDLPITEDVENVWIGDCNGLPDYNNYINGESPYKGLKSVVIENLNCNIGKFTFSGCKNLETFEVHGENELPIIIGVGAFEDTGLKHIKIPSNVVHIGSDAFANCTKLESLELSPTQDLTIHVTQDKPGSNYKVSGAFTNCKNLSSISVDGMSTFYYNIPHNWPWPESYAIYPWAESNIRKFVVGDNRSYASVDFFVTASSKSNNYPSIASTLEELEFGQQVEDIQMSGSRGNYDSSKIKKITIKNLTPPELEGHFSDWTLINAVLNVPQDAIETYKNHPVWGKFWNIQGCDFSIGGVDNIVTSAPTDSNNDIYSIQGVLIKRNASSEDIDKLPSGFYIIGGKKRIIRK